MLLFKELTFLLSISLYTGFIYAQPSNDDCSNARPLCPNISVSGTTVAATTQCNGPDGDCLSSGTWGQCYDVNNSVWFTFMTNNLGGNVNINISNISCFNTTGSDELQGVLLSAGTACDATSYTALDCNTGNANSFILSASGLSANTLYWVHIDGNDQPLPMAECNFNITLSGSAVNWIVDTSSTPPLCNDGSDGTATVTPESGTSPYSYQWDSNAGNQTTQTATGLSAGSYQVAITDNNGCDTTVEVVVVPPPPIQPNAGSTDASCSNADGSASVTPTNGTAPYSYQWDANAGNQTTQTATGLSAGSYQVTITDDNGCTLVATVLVNNTGGPNVTTDSTEVTCPHGSDGSATVNPSGGSTPYTYQWDANTGNQTTQTATALSSGSYVVTVTDNNGCITMAVVTVVEPPPWDVTDSTVDENCDNSDGSATVTPNGATSPYNYQWDTNAGSQNTATATGLSAGNYSVTITDANNCDTVVNVIISQTQAITAIQTSTIDATCSANDGQITIISVSGGSGPYQYSLDGSSFQGSNTFNNLSAGSYTVYVKDDNGCTQTTTAVINQPDAVVPVPVVTNKDCNNNGSIVVSASGGTSPYQFSVNGGSPQSDGNFLNLNPGTYTITVIDDNGCENTTTVSVGDDCEKPPMHPATGFSPNGDGKNDVWSIANAQYYDNCKITVFDRWGQKVFSQTGYDIKWDGRSMGYPVPASTYYYIIWLDKGDKSQGFIYGYVAIVR